MKRLTLIFLILFVFAPICRADSDLDQIEQIFHKRGQSSEPTFIRPGRHINAPIVNFSQIRKLENYRDIAVITRRFLPKTDRFEASFGTGMLVNDAFFDDIDMSGRLGFHFSEQYSAELSLFKVIPSARDVISGLQNHGVQTSSLVTPLMYFGADLKWCPIYGKMAFLNRKIIHFDHYFTVGGGSTVTNAATSAPTLQFGTGEIFALNKNWAFRWDLDWMSYSVATNSITGAGGSINQTINNIYVTLGFSFFFPGATYR